MAATGKVGERGRDEGGFGGGLRSKLFPSWKYLREGNR